MWPSQFDSENSEIYEVIRSEKHQNFSIAADVDVIDIMDEIKLEPVISLSIFDTFLTNLEYSGNLPKLGITLTLFSSENLDTGEEEYDSLGFCFTHTIKNAQEDDIHNASEIFVALDAVYLSSLTDPSRKSHLEHEIRRINTEMAEDLAALIGFANPKATWHQSIDLDDTDSSETTRLISDVAAQNLQDALFFDIQQVHK